MTDTSTKAPPRKDPLSAFLIGAAIVLAIMYGLESWSSSTLETQTLVAAQIGANYLKTTEALTSCSIGAAGQKGEVLLMRCTEGNVNDTALALHGLALNELSSFGLLHIHGAEGTAVCPLNHTDWPAHCTTT